MLAKRRPRAYRSRRIVYTFKPRFNGEWRNKTGSDAFNNRLKRYFASRSIGTQLDRESAIREVARALGFGRTGSRIVDAIDSALIVAAKRGVIQNNRGVLSLWSRNIGDYSRDEMINALLSVMGVVWWEREEAIRAAARHLGFRRTGSLIRDAFKSAINGAIRRGLLEYDGSMIRKAKG